MSQEQPVTQVIWAIMQFQEVKRWIKISLSSGYQDVVDLAKATFPELNMSEFIFTDTNNVILDPDFFVEFLEASGRGVTIIVKVTQNVIIIESPEENLTDDNASPAPKRRRDIDTFVDERVMTKEKLRKILESNNLGKTILEDYEKNKFFLTKKARRDLIKVIVNDLLQLKKRTQSHLTKNIKIQYATAIIEVFPNIKDENTPLGYECFFNPADGKGYISTGLSNATRTQVNEQTEKPYKKKKKPSESFEPPATVVPERFDETDLIKDAINFMKYATPEQKTEIIKKAKETFKYRRFMYPTTTFFEHFPRFLDVPELIDVEFQLLFPLSNPNIFCELYPKFANGILNVYRAEKIDAACLDWDRVTNSFIAITQLCPPSARGKKKASREKAQDSIHKYITFKQTGTPVNTNQDEAGGQPKLIAVGPNKLAINQYFLSIDGHCIMLPTTNIVKATEYVLKAHYVFNTQFDIDLTSFWLFLQHYFLKIESKTTNVVSETYIKVSAYTKNCNESDKE